MEAVCSASSSSDLSRLGMPYDSTAPRRDDTLGRARFVCHMLRDAISVSRRRSRQLSHYVCVLRSSPEAPRPKMRGRLSPLTGCIAYNSRYTVRIRRSRPVFLCWSTLTWSRQYRCRRKHCSSCLSSQSPLDILRTG